jgi:RNA polymerase sigma-70 factor, ECF subfamily
LETYLVAATRIPTPETELVLRLQQRDEKALGELYKRYSAALYGVLRRVVRDEELAQDLLQEAFVKIWKNIDRYDVSRGTLFTFMLNVARNLGIDKLRSAEFSRAKQTDRLDDFVGLAEASASYASPEDGIGLNTVIDQLKPDHKELIHLIYYKGYTQAEVAEALQMPLGTVKTRLRAALLVLRGHLGSDLRS